MPQVERSVVFLYPFLRKEGKVYEDTWKNKSTV